MTTTIRRTDVMSWFFFLRQVIHFLRARDVRVRLKGETPSSRRRPGCTTRQLNVLAARALALMCMCVCVLAQKNRTTSHSQSRITTLRCMCILCTRLTPSRRYSFCKERSSCARRMPEWGVCLCVWTIFIDTPGIVQYAQDGQDGRAENTRQVKVHVDDFLKTIALVLKPKLRRCTRTDDTKSVAFINKHCIAGQKASASDIGHVCAVDNFQETAAHTNVVPDAVAKNANYARFPRTFAGRIGAPHIQSDFSPIRLASAARVINFYIARCMFTPPVHTCAHTQ